MDLVFSVVLSGVYNAIALFGDLLLVADLCVEKAENNSFGYQRLGGVGLGALWYAFDARFRLLLKRLIDTPPPEYRISGLAPQAAWIFPM